MAKKSDLVKEGAAVPAISSITAAALGDTSLAALIGNAKQRATRRNKAQENTLKMRSFLWPNVDPSHLWHRKLNDGYTTIPRTIPLLMNIIADLSKGVAGGKSRMSRP